ncbi:hypothetical protein P3L51_20850 [Streptomyces sp. PSRA5]|uniref:hypothetical protein n=1 Tax=Streptomyces panacea TaxID=3035064 RepID=UPI00339CC731
MELWDQEIEPYAQSLERLEAANLANLTFCVIEESIPLIGPPFGCYFPSDHAALIESVLAFRLDHLTDWRSDSEFAANFLARYDGLPDVAVRPAVGPFFMALVRIFEAFDHPMSADEAMEILSCCYESILMSHLTGRVTLKDEQNSDQCVAAIDSQVEIIRAHI